MLERETYGRRDTDYIYSGDVLRAAVKGQFKLNMPGAGENSNGAGYCDLYRGPGEEMPDSTEVAAWGGAEGI